MEEHLIGVQINDQKAHLLKVIGDVRDASADLAGIFDQIESAKGEHQLAQQALLSIQAQIEDAKIQNSRVERDCNTLISLANKKWDEAEQHYQDSHANATLEEIRAELIRGDIKSLNEQLNELEGFIATSEDQAARITNDVGSLEQKKSDLAAEIKGLQGSVKVLDDFTNEMIENGTKTLLALSKKIEEAQATLVAKRAETASLFAHLDEREKKVEVAEQDNQILRSRLYELLKEQQKKL